jgi:GxxExxY protein
MECTGETHERTLVAAIILASEISFKIELLPSLAIVRRIRKNQMHPDYSRAQALSREVIGAGVEVHRVLGPGLLESIYEKCLRRELELRGLTARQQDQVRIEYKGFAFVEQLRFDLLVENCLLVEVKAVQATLPIHKAQLLSYMKLLAVPLGLVMNFHEMKLVDGVSRMVLHDAAGNS